MKSQIAVANYRDLTNVAIALPSRENKSGWGVCTLNLISAFKKINSTWEILGLPRDYPLKRDKVIGAIVDPTLAARQDFIWGRVQCAYGFIEDNVEIRNYILNAERYWDHICCGSSWMKEQLEEAGYHSCSVVIQGIDHIKPVRKRKEVRGSQFTVFSGGKFQYRKSQDLVIAAMKQVMAKHNDVCFVCAWGNPWLSSMDTMAESPFITYAGTSSRWQDRIIATLAQNGIPLERCEILPLLDNSDMPAVYNRCNLAVFPNRCEGGTNLVAMETIACGLTSIVSYNSGHKDIISPDDPLALKSFRLIEAHDARGEVRGLWDEPVLDELIERIEYVYNNYYPLQIRALQQAAKIKKFTWDKTAQEIVECLALADRESLTAGSATCFRR
jgi:glycosyltransferase involved in cell wall biosynthesis